MVERNISQKKSSRKTEGKQEAVKPAKQKKVDTLTSQFKVAASDQIDSIHFRHVKTNAARNNRVISFKERTILNRRDVKRVKADAQLASLHKLASL